VAGRVIDAAVFDLVPDNNETDLAALYEDGSMVIYHDQLLGHYQAQPLSQRIVGGSALQARDINNDGWTDLIAMSSAGLRLLINDHGKLLDGPAGPPEKGAMALVDLANRSLADVVVNGSIYRNMGNGKFERVNADSLLRGVAVAEADFDGDGRAELAIATTSGSVELAKNTSPVTNHSMRVRLEGVKNLKLSSGAVVEVKQAPGIKKELTMGHLYSLAA